MSDASGQESCVVCAAALSSQPTARLPAARLNACNACGTLHYWPRATPAEQIARHAAPEYLSHPYFRNRRAQLRRSRARCRDIFAEVARATDVRSLAGQRVLDVGCGTGELLEAARELIGIVPMGLDVSRGAVAALGDKGIEGHLATLAEAPPEVSGLRLILAIDVIEHVLDPLAFLREVARRLRPGGLGYFETPNPSATVYRLGGALSRLSRGRPAAVFERLFPPEHQYYFPHAALQHAARAAGLQVARLFSRRMPAVDAALSFATRSALGLSQLVDLATGDRLLLCLVVKKPEHPGA